MILIGYRHGLRASELCDLQWSQVELATGRLHVRRPKNGSPRSRVCCAGKSTTADAPDVQGAFMYGVLDFDVKSVFSMETDDEEGQYAWDCRWSRVIGCGALFASMVARKECGALP